MQPSNRVAPLIFAAIVVAAVVVSACVSLAPATCNADEIDPPPALNCDLAIGAARGRLFSISGVESIEVHHGGVCHLSPEGRCPFMDVSTSATIIVGMDTGGDLMFVVNLQPDGNIVSSDPQPVPVPVGPGSDQP